MMPPKANAPKPKAAQPGVSAQVANATVTGIPQRMVGALRALGLVLERLEQGQAGWQEWTQVAPITPEVSEQLHLQPLEKILDQKLGHLMEVCIRPRDSLRLELERLPVSRARRVPARAFANLASRPEDWERRTLRAVVPRRVQTLLPEEELNLYENRVVVRLIDHLRHALVLRQQQLHDLKRLLQQADSLQKEVREGSWGARHRACTLIGDLFLDNHALSELIATLRELERLDASLKQLQATRLYRTLPQQQISPVLEATNILINDQHYRQVAALWRAWARLGRFTDSPRQLEEDWRHFSRFCALLVIRALELFKLEPEVEEGTEPRAIQTGLDFTVQGKLGRFTLRREESRLLVTVEDLPDRCLEFRCGAKVPGTLEPDPQCEVVWLRPGHAEPDSVRELRVSPLELGSVELVMGAIQRWVLEARFLAYPAEVPVPSTFPPSVLEQWNQAEWVRVEEGPPRLLKITKSPQGNGQALKALIGQLKNHLEQLPARERTKYTGLDFAMLEQVMTKALLQQKRLQLCPVCQTDADSRNFQAREPTFVCFCMSCKSRWETRLCYHCKRRFPLLDVRNRVPEKIDRELHSGLQSKDVLSRQKDGHWDDWICSHCGY